MDKKGRKYLFSSDDHSFHFEALRVLQYAPYKAADVNEVLTAVSQIKNDDTESWYRSWYQMAQLIERKGDGYENKLDKGYAYLRAQNYYRTSEFFLKGNDPRRDDTWMKQKSTFQQALDNLQVKHHVLKVPYGEHYLKAVYYPSDDPQADKRPLIMACNGYDGTIEELYAWLAQSANERGYHVLLYEGPGQGSVIREQQLTFTPEWHKPTSAVLDHFYANFTAPQNAVLIATSFAAIIGMDAAAKDKRIKGYVAFNVWYDYVETSSSFTPKWILGLWSSGYRNLGNALMRLGIKGKTKATWAINQGMWTMGAEDPAALWETMQPYTSKHVLNQVTCDVLLLEGENDHFLRVTDQLGKTKRGLTNARSVTTVIFKAGEGGEEHCQVGAIMQFQAELFRWIEQTFGSSSLSASPKEASKEVYAGDGNDS